MGLSEEEQKKTQELRFKVHGGSSMDRSLKETTQTNEESGRVCESQTRGEGCCQVNGDFSCCQNPMLEEKREDPPVVPNFATETKKSSKKPVSRKNSGKGVGPRRVCSMPTWYESWEREDTYAALAVVMAAISVAFAYKCYRQSS